MPLAITATPTSATPTSANTPRGDCLKSSGPIHRPAETAAIPKKYADGVVRLHYEVPPPRRSSNS